MLSMKKSMNLFQNQHVVKNLHPRCLRAGHCHMAWRQPASVCRGHQGHPWWCTICLHWCCWKRAQETPCCYPCRRPQIWLMAATPVTPRQLSELLVQPPLPAALAPCSMPATERCQPELIPRGSSLMACLPPERGQPDSVPTGSMQDPGRCNTRVAAAPHKHLNLAKLGCMG